MHEYPPRVWKASVYSPEHRSMRNIWDILFLPKCFSYCDWNIVCRCCLVCGSTVHFVRNPSQILAQRTYMRTHTEGSLNIHVSCVERDSLLNMLWMLTWSVNIKWTDWEFTVRIVINHSQEKIIWKCMLKLNISERGVMREKWERSKRGVMREKGESCVYLE